jgi:hypothetical protein
MGTMIMDKPFIDNKLMALLVALQGHTGIGWTCLTPLGVAGVRESIIGFFPGFRQESCGRVTVNSLTF